MLRAVQEFLANFGAIDWIVVVIGVLLVMATYLVVRHWFLQPGTQG
jgi:hypothetical protein